MSGFNMQGMPSEIREIASRLNAAEALVAASDLELQAALHTARADDIEKARVKCLMAFEAMLDRKIDFLQKVKTL